MTGIQWADEAAGTTTSSKCFAGPDTATGTLVRPFKYTATDLASSRLCSHAQIRGSPPVSSIASPANSNRLTSAAKAATVAPSRRSGSLGATPSAGVALNSDRATVKSSRLVLWTSLFADSLEQPVGSTQLIRRPRQLAPFPQERDPESQLLEQPRHTAAGARRRQARRVVSAPPRRAARPVRRRAHPPLEPARVRPVRPLLAPSAPSLQAVQERRLSISLEILRHRRSC